MLCIALWGYGIQPFLSCLVSEAVGAYCAECSAGFLTSCADGEVPMTRPLCITEPCRSVGVRIMLCFSQEIQTGNEIMATRRTEKQGIEGRKRANKGEWKRRLRCGSAVLKQSCSFA
jgi:hypothetical protein